MPAKPWTIQSARLRCPHCGKTVTMRFKGRWSIRKALGVDSATPQSPLSMTPETDKDEGQERGDG